MRSFVISVIAVTTLGLVACKEKSPDGDWQPKTVAAADTGVTTPDTEVGAPPAATPQPPSSPDVATVGGTDAAKPIIKTLGTVNAVEGKPVILRDTMPHDAVVGLTLQAGDVIETFDKTKVQVKLEDGSVLAVGPRSKVRLKKYDLDGGRRSGSVSVAIGTFWFQISKWARPEQSAIDIETPNAVAGVRGTTLWGDTQRSVICALEGTVVVNNLSNKHALPATLEAGHCVGNLIAGKMTPLTPNAATVKKYLDETLVQQPK